MITGFFSSASCHTLKESCLRMNSLVSIPLITYNGDRFLRYQLDSIFSQTYKNIEVIAVDDGSCDGTISILEEFKKSHGLEIVINSHNLGYMRNFEKAVIRCRGDFIAPSDQDDIWMPDKISRLVSEIGKKSMVCSDAIIIDSQDKKISDSAFAYSSLILHPEKPFCQLLFNSSVIGCTCLFKRELIKNSFPIPEGEKYHDWWLSIVASILDGIEYVREPLILYRQHEQNILGLKRIRTKVQKMFGFFRGRPDRAFFADQAKRLDVMSMLPIFNESHKQDIVMAKTYYEDRLKPGLHCRAFFIAIRMGKYIFPREPLLLRMKSVAGCLFR